MFEKITKDKRFDEERAFYGFKDIIVENCEFSGSLTANRHLKNVKILLSKIVGLNFVTLFGMLTNLQYPVPI